MQNNSWARLLAYVTGRIRFSAIRPGQSAPAFDGSKHRSYPGRPPVGPELEALILRMAQENKGWGYDRMVGALANLGHPLSDQTVGIVNTELNENVELARPSSIPPCSAQRPRVASSSVSAAFKSRTTLQLENLALRHQLCVLRRSVKRPKLTPADRPSGFGYAKFGAIGDLP
jgi:hypothetical protein